MIRIMIPTRPELFTEILTVILWLFIRMVTAAGVMMMAIPIHSAQMRMYMMRMAEITIMAESRHM